MYVYDIECYRNYFLLCMVNVGTGERYLWERYNDNLTGHLQLPNSTYVGFNSMNYDWPMLSLAAAGATNAELKALNDRIIMEGIKHWQHDHDLLYALDQVDLIEVLPGVASLKIYGGRIGFKKLQDLPLDPSQLIVDEHVAPMRNYCFNDCEVTDALRNKVSGAIELRTRLGEAYGVDLRSKSDAQIAEAVITNQYHLVTGERVEKPSSTALIGTAYRYNPPPWMSFDTPVMRDVFATVLGTEFVVNDKGKIDLPKTLTGKSILLHGRRYKMGIGGLHSMDKAATFDAEDDDHVIFDIDVTSYYPSIILNNHYAPTQMGDDFLTIYRDLVVRRLNAKASGDKVTADSLKITINGSFGKFGSRYSKLYAPDLMFHVTLTGQLALLMLIERLPGAVVSANTDGITLYLPRHKVERLREWVTWWEQTTGFSMEWTEYRSYHRLDVNNYLAIKPDGTTKRKGRFAQTGLMKNPVNEIVIQAVIENLQNGTPVHQTVMACNDITQFVQLRTVRGGAMKDGQAFGKSVRWYRSNVSTSNIYYANGNKVSGTERSRIVQDLPDSIPPDLDREWYINEATELLEKLCESLNP